MSKPERVVEAALFSAGRPVSVEEIAEATGLDAELVRRTVKKLIRSSKNRDTSVEVVKAGAKYAMQLKREMVPAAAKLAKTDIPRRLLKTLALIAYHQPIKQSELLEMVGSKVYDHVKDLHQLGLIFESPSGQTKILSTSNRFPEYFGIKTTKREEIKKWMAENVGIKTDGSQLGVKPAAEILTGQQTLDSAGAAGEGARAGEAGRAGEGAKKVPPGKDSEGSRGPIRPPSDEEEGDSGPEGKEEE